MKKELNPLAMAGIIIVAIVLLGIVGYQMLKPPGYYPSPGAYGTGGAMPGAVNASAGNASKPAAQEPAGYYPVAPSGSTPGKPLAPGTVPAQPNKYGYH